MTKLTAFRKAVAARSGTFYADRTPGSRWQTAFVALGNGRTRYCTVSVSGEINTGDILTSDDVGKFTED